LSQGQSVRKGLQLLSYWPVLR